METCLVKRTKRDYVKRHDTAVIYQSVIYDILDKEDFSIPILVSARAITPDVFEIEVDDESGENSNDLVNKIAYFVERISIRDHFLTKCPSCGKSIAIFDNHVICMNIDCSKEKNVIISKLVSLFRNIPINDLLFAINIFFENDECTNVNDFIEKVINFENKSLDIFFHQLRELIIENLLTLNLEVYFKLLLGDPLPLDISNIVKIYNNKIISMIEDTEHSKIKGCSQRAKILAKLAVESNQRFLDIVKSS